MLSDKIKSQIESARLKLLDLTNRNPLLNFHESKRRTIRVIDELPREIYNILVIEEKSMRFKPSIYIKPNDDSILELGNVFGGDDDSGGLSDSDQSILWQTPDLQDSPESKYTDLFLQTNLDSRSLQKRLFYIYKQSQSFIEEQGFVALFLAMGFLKWTEDDKSNVEHRAPLILTPVELLRETTQSAFRLHWTGEDIITNISLQSRLFDFGIKVPEFIMPEEKKGIVKYFESIQRAISQKKDWAVLGDISLGFFNFNKFIMYKDLDLSAWSEEDSPQEHPLLNAILNPDPSEQPQDTFEEHDIDLKLKALDSYHIMDADPSQMAVIENAKNGHNLVVEGPPGTGKSQTIANIIAELMGMGKSILFVSEKMAALEVVKGRLDNADLGDFCLELHSRKSRKKEVLKELERSMHNSILSNQSYENEFKKLEKLKIYLNDYARSLRLPIGKINKSPYELFNIKEIARKFFEKEEQSIPYFKIENIAQRGNDDFIEAVDALENLEKIVSIAWPIKNSPWYGCDPAPITPKDEIDIKSLVEECISSIDMLKSLFGKLTNLCGLKELIALGEIDTLLCAAKVMAMAPKCDANILLSENWNEPNEGARELYEKIKEYREISGDLSQRMKHEALKQNLPEIYQALSSYSRNILRMFSPRYRKYKNKCKSLYKGTAPKKYLDILSDFNIACKAWKTREYIQKSKKEGESLFGSFWNAENSDLEVLSSFSKWVIPYRKMLKNGNLSRISADFVSHGIDGQEVDNISRAADKAYMQFSMNFESLLSRLNADSTAILGGAFNNVGIEDIRRLLFRWQQDIGKLQIWSQYIRHKNACQDSIARGVIDLLEDEKLRSDQLIKAFQANFADQLLAVAFTERPSLNDFMPAFHESRIKNFMEIDKNIIDLNRRRLAYKIQKERPQLYSNASQHSELGILQSEFNRKRGHMPIRKLISTTGQLLQKIKPCFMLSPISIAQFLDPNSLRFDVIIFDEASQVKPEDALGAFLRGNQAIVIGDTKQLPPTSFFDYVVESDENNEDNYLANLSDMESILHQCKRVFYTQLLKWHYRSRHESLIAVSNHEFYDSKLLIYPSPMESAKELGLKHLFLAESIYDRGKSSTNRIEAKAIAKAAIAHFREYPDKSLGVGTFNIKQQQAILEEIELQLKFNQEMEEYFSPSNPEHFFVKNLETIQGDERDVIFISVGFGYDSNGKISLNFGPLNYDGGERRLNVLITRAREKCVVYSNFHGTDLPDDAKTAFGVRALRTFLEFAENKRFVESSLGLQDSDSPFEDSVFEFIRDNGYVVNRQVGCAGFRVDLGIVDPEHQGQYILGIECDGYKYHSSPVARDRDRLRQQLLENRGWKIYRIWSTDWYRNTQVCRENLLRAIKRAIRNGKTRQNSNICSIQKANSEIPSERSLNQEISEDDNLFDKTMDIQIPISEYKLYRSLEIPIILNLNRGDYNDWGNSRQDWNSIIAVLNEIVKYEGPIHQEELVRRLTSIAGYRRIGRKINEIFIGAIRKAVKNGWIKINGPFIWENNKTEVVPRMRVQPELKNIDLICDEEITATIIHVIKCQYSTGRDDLINQTARTLGLQRTTNPIFERISKIIDCSIKNATLKRLPGDMIDIA